MFSVNHVREISWPKIRSIEVTFWYILDNLWLGLFCSQVETEDVARMRFATSFCGGLKLFYRYLVANLGPHLPSSEIVIRMREPSNGRTKHKVSKYNLPRNLCETLLAWRLSWPILFLSMNIYKEPWWIIIVPVIFPLSFNQFRLSLWHKLYELVGRAC